MHAVCIATLYVSYGYNMYYIIRTKGEGWRGSGVVSGGKGVCVFEGRGARIRVCLRMTLRAAYG